MEIRIFVDEKQVIKFARPIKAANIKVCLEERIWLIRPLHNSIDTIAIVSMIIVPFSSLSSPP